MFGLYEVHASINVTTRTHGSYLAHKLYDLYVHLYIVYVHRQPSNYHLIYVCIYFCFLLERSNMEFDIKIILANSIRWGVESGNAYVALNYCFFFFWIVLVVKRFFSVLFRIENWHTPANDWIFSRRDFSFVIRANKFVLFFIYYIH